jgi:hypothetical protein
MALGAEQAGPLKKSFFVRSPEPLFRTATSSEKDVTVIMNDTLETSVLQNSENYLRKCIWRRSGRQRKGEGKWN